MATLTPGYIYFIESDAGDNQNWLTVSTPPDPEDIVIGDFEEGTDFCKLEIPSNFRIQGVTGLTVTHVGGASSYMLRYNKRAYRIMNQGIETSRANAILVTDFIMHDRHTASASATFKQYYLVIKEATDAYEKFVDQADVSQKYCKGVILNFSKTWSESDPITRMIQINWESTWRT